MNVACTINKYVCVCGEEESESHHACEFVCEITESYQGNHVLADL